MTNEESSLIDRLYGHHYAQGTTDTAEIVHEACLRIAGLEADLKAEWANLNSATEALRNLVFAVDHVDWDCTASAAFGRLDDARAAARAVLAPQSNPGVTK